MYNTISLWHIMSLDIVNKREREERTKEKKRKFSGREGDYKREEKKN